MSSPSKDRSSQNTMKRCGSGRRSAISSGSVSMSSRWISMSLSGRVLSPAWRLIAAWTAFTSDDLPMPRAPQRRALLAGSPSAKRSVLSAKRVPHPVDAAQERDIDPVDLRDRRAGAARPPATRRRPRRRNRPLEAPAGAIRSSASAILARSARVSGGGGSVAGHRHINASGVERGERVAGRSRLHNRRSAAYLGTPGASIGSASP